MEPTDWDRLEALYSELAALPPDARARRLEAIRGDSAELAAELASLLPHDDPDIDRFRVVRAAADPPLESIGPYRIVRELGSGGMGVVYLAEQLCPVERRVALKVIRAGMDTERVLERFEAERQTLARLSHPGIAHILEAGRTAEGRPYFALEYVDGTPIQEWCDAKALGTRERLRLFVLVCRALQHAHDRGIVHRDLKPSNILVTEIDGAATPKLIDFGIARSTGPDMTAHTRQGQILGTPEYMSPEQARLDATELDHRSDLYSLGLVLHELLVGDLPFDRRELRRLGPADLQRWVSEREAPRPSSRTDLTGTAARERGTTPSALRSELRGDLDWIVLRALEKEPSRRYPSAAALAEDLECFLGHRPVSATPPSRGYLLRKFVRRHRTPVAAASVLFLALVAGLVVAVALYRNERERSEKLLRLSDTRGLVDLVDRARALWPATPERIPALESWLDDARELADRLPLHRRGLEELRRQALPYEDADRERDAREFSRLPELRDVLQSIAGLEKELAEDLTAPRRQLVEDTLAKQRGIVAELEGTRARYRRFEFPSADLSWQHDVLSRLVDDLESFADPGTQTLNSPAEVEARLAHARARRDLDFPGYDEAWRDAREALGIPEQPGLLPLGPDPRSGLWEFAVLSTGAVPRRDAAGTLVRDESTAIVLVHIPGGSFDQGAARLTLGCPLDESLRAGPIAEGSFASALALREGDRITHFGEDQVGDAASFGAALRGAVTGDVIAVRVLRDGAALTLTSTVPGNIDPQAAPNESPVHRVDVEPFLLSKYEVNQAQWYRIARERPSHFDPFTLYAGHRSTEMHPVERVSWVDCRDHLARHELEIPTESQWEYAARAGTTTPWFTGTEPGSLAGFANLLDATAERAGYRQSSNFSREIEDGFLIDAPVGRFEPNGFGLHDTVGNVFEWCRDGFRSYGPSEGASEPPGLRRVIRGGSWGLPAVECRSSTRAVAGPELRTTDFGIRPSRAILP